MYDVLNALHVDFLKLFSDYFLDTDLLDSDRFFKDHLLMK